jgi:hypothetical protein
MGVGLLLAKARASETASDPSSKQPSFLNKEDGFYGTPRKETRVFFGVNHRPFFSQKKGIGNLGEPIIFISRSVVFFEVSKDLSFNTRNEKRKGFGANPLYLYKYLNR